MKIRSIVITGAVAAGLWAAPAPAGAEHCSGRQTPPAAYSGRGTKTTALGWTAHAGSPSDPFVGAHYADGYVYADGSGGKLTYRSFTPFWPRYVDVLVVVGPGGVEQNCVHPGEGQP